MIEPSRSIMLAVPYPPNIGASGRTDVASADV